MTTILVELWTTTMAIDKINTSYDHGYACQKWPPAIVNTDIMLDSMFFFLIPVYFEDIFVNK